MNFYLLTYIYILILLLLGSIGEKLCKSLLNWLLRKIPFFKSYFRCFIEFQICAPHVQYSSSIYVYIIHYFFISLSIEELTYRLGFIDYIWAKQILTIRPWLYYLKIVCFRVTSRSQPNTVLGSWIRIRAYHCLTNP